MLTIQGKLRSFFAILAIFLWGLTAHAQQQGAPAVREFTVPEAVDYALANYPAVRAALEQYNAASAQVSVARTSYIPRLDSVWQGDRGSRESVLGVLLPQSPNILTGTQGSVTPHANRPFWTSGAGVLLSWEPFDFGFRQAQIASAQSTQERTAAQVTLTRLGVATAVAESALALLADEQRVNAVEADVHRREIFAKSVQTLVDARLRPGGDASRAEAELAVARTRFILAQQEIELGGIALGQMLGIAGTRVSIRSGPFLQAPPQESFPESAVQEHPAAVVQKDRVNEEKSLISVLNHSYFPHFTTEGLLSARGSGERTNGTVEPGLNGLDFSAYNWEAGLTVQMNLTEIFSIHERKRVEVAKRRREEAIYKQTIEAITAQQQAAKVQLGGARRVAENTPIELIASRQGETQATARYRAGLGTIVDVAEAQSLLAQAEMDDSLARIRIWRALAELSAANGSLAPFLNNVKGMSSGGN
jgi:outer membrane protein TolC